LLVYGPDAAPIPEYARTLRLEGSEVAFTLPTALDDPPGSYRLNARDVVGGGSTDAVLDLR
jgi:hypothetical protein